MPKGFKINNQEVARMMRDLQAEIDKHKITVPVDAEVASLAASGTTNIYNAPVFSYNGDHGQVAFGNTVHQTQNTTKTVAAGYEPLAAVMAEILQSLPRVGLSQPDAEDVRVSAEEVLGQVTEPTPDDGIIRRAVRVIKGVLVAAATGAGAGAVEAASQDWISSVIQQLQGF